MKMQPPSTENKQFLEDYNTVLAHHVECMLKSHMLLDEDMHLVLTFWDPNMFASNSKWLPNVLTSSAYATVGVMLSLQLRTVYPLAVATASVTWQVFQNAKQCYYTRKYKRNFQKLLSLIFELYELNRNILDYYHKRDMAAQDCKMPNEAYTILLKPGEEFLKSTTLFLIGILEKIRDTMLNVSELVPLTEGNYIYSLDWDLEQFKNLDGKDFKELQHQFQKLCDIYVLIVSNFLSCVGLSFCVQLWKETACSFQNIFDDLIPRLISTLETSLNNINKNFNHIRFTLYDTEDKILKKEKFKPSTNIIKLQQPLSDYLTNMQVTFETAKQLQILTSQCDSNKKHENLYPLVENMKSQFEICDDSLNTFLKVFYILTKHPIIKNVEMIPLALANNTTSKISAEIHYDDPLEMLEDEEYNLSIHGSDGGNSGPEFFDYVDDCSTEHLELMLFELKKKLKERKGGQDEHSKIINHNSLKIEPAVANSTVEQRTPPVPPPIPFLNQDRVEQLPTVDSVHIGLLDAVKSVAQKLNRDEEVFGCDADISDSDEL